MWHMFLFVYVLYLSGFVSDILKKFLVFFHFSAVLLECVLTIQEIFYVSLSLFCYQEVIFVIYLQR